MPLEKIRMGKDIIFDVIVTDVDGRTLEKWKCMRRDFPKIVRILANKFGLNVSIIDRQRDDRDLDWLK